MKSNCVSVMIINVACSICLFIYMNSLIRIISACTLVAALWLIPVLKNTGRKKGLIIVVITYCILLYSILVNCLMDYQFMDVHNWLYALIVTVIYILVLVFVDRNKQFKLLATMTLFLLSYFILVSFISVINVELNKNVDLYSVSIEEKAYSESYTFNPRYEFLVMGVLDEKEYWINVPFEMYTTEELGSEMKVCIGEGVFGCKYYYLQNNRHKNYVVDKSIIIRDERFYEYLDKQKKL